MDGLIVHWSLLIAYDLLHLPDPRTISEVTIINTKYHLHEAREKREWNQRAHKWTWIPICNSIYVSIINWTFFFTVSSVLLLFFLMFFPLSSSKQNRLLVIFAAKLTVNEWSNHQTIYCVFFSWNSVLRILLFFPLIILSGNWHFFSDENQKHVEQLSVEQY